MSTGGVLRERSPSTNKISDRHLGLVAKDGIKSGRHSGCRGGGKLAARDEIWHCSVRFSFQPWLILQFLLQSPAICIERKNSYEAEVLFRSNEYVTMQNISLPTLCLKDCCEKAATFDWWFWTRNALLDVAEWDRGCFTEILKDLSVEIGGNNSWLTLFPLDQTRSFALERFQQTLLDHLS